MYVTLGSIFRRFEHLKGNELSEYDLLYDDFFASHRPMDAVKFHVIEQDFKELGHGDKRCGMNMI